MIVDPRFLIHEEYKEVKQILFSIFLKLISHVPLFPFSLSQVFLSQLHLFLLVIIPFLQLFLLHFFLQLSHLFHFPLLLFVFLFLFLFLLQSSCPILCHYFLVKKIFLSLIGFEVLGRNYY